MHQAGQGRGAPMEPLPGDRGHALLVSGAIGLGHDAMAQTCAASLASRGWSTQTADAMRLLGRRASGAGEQVFRSLLAVPGLYDAYYFAALRPGNRLALLTDAAARRRIVPALTRLLDQRPAHLAISVFATGASAVSAVAERYPAMRHVVFCADVTPHRLWVHPHVDMYLVTSRVAECAVRRFAPQAQVRIVPPPVRAAFRTPPSRAQARDTLGIPAEARCVLVMSGGWGLGPVAEVASALADAGVQALAVAGRNNRLEAALRAAARRQPGIRAFGYTDRIPELMAASDLVITSSGGTCAEARAVGRPLLVLDVVPGHGRDNCQHELELGHASVTSADPGAVVSSTLAALAAAPDPATRAATGGGAPDGPPRPAHDWEAAFSAVLAALHLPDPAPSRNRRAP